MQKLLPEKEIMYFGEVFIYVNWNGIIVYRYIISNFGRLYDLEKQKFKNPRQDKDGYYITNIAIPNIGHKSVKIHRIELMSFHPVDNFEELQTNHKDGNKQNIMLYNLEWLTPIENTRHGWETGLNKNKGNVNGNGKLSDEEIHKICNLIDKGYSSPQITDIFNISNSEDRMKFQSIISSIKYGKTHRDISKLYNFMQGKNFDIKSRYSENFAHLICHLLSDNKEYSYYELANLLSIPENELMVFKIFVTDIIRGRTYKNVSTMYGKLNKPKSY